MRLYPAVPVSVAREAMDDYTVASFRLPISSALFYPPNLKATTTLSLPTSNKTAPYIFPYFPSLLQVQNKGIRALAQVIMAAESPSSARKVVVRLRATRDAPILKQAKFKNFGFDGKLVINYACSMAWG
ncbi:hypothetical protein ES319_D04G201800v1 [Gossypium barbadense]|uniref:Ubiquitin-like protein ATG12 n=1 Tax=Gossypium barbadense TaxID=3634 RepID=A0A5J5RXT1_GOSBA|nr:hypothetical protein ES319_D04G201800v1 [Gossypium barbadense]